MARLHRGTVLAAWVGLTITAAAALSAGCDKTTKPAQDRASASSASSMPSEKAASSDGGAGGLEGLGIGSSSDTPDVKAESGDAKKLAPGVNDFAVDLWRRLPTGNLAISPASISLALAMAYGGARGETAAQMKKVLRADEPAATVAAWGKTQRQLTVPNRPLQLSIANRLFGAKGFPVEQPFVDQTSAAFGAGLQALDFAGAPEPSRQTINGWVEDQTNHRIKDLLPQGTVDPKTKLVIVNAIYFLAGWDEPFRVQDTQKAPFSVDASRKKDVDMMANVQPYRYRKADKVTVVELPYKKDAAAMYIVLPDATDGLAEVERGLTTKKLTAWLDDVSFGFDRYDRVRLWMPRFEIAPPDPLLLTKTLTAMGMPLAFDREKADLSGIAKSADPKDVLHVDEVVHKAWVKVDEKGTEAAAATALSMKGGGGPPTKFLEVHVDHPFLFVIRDRPSGMILFAGRVVDP